MNTSTDNWNEIKTASQALLPPDIVAYIETCRQEPHPESQLINVLHRVQGHYGHLGREQLDAVAQLMQIPTAKVTGVATFYHFFRLTPRGKFVIKVCLGTACYVKGAERLSERIREELGISFGETTKDGLFSLEATRCLGTCGLAPAIVIEDEVHGQVTPDQIPALLERYVKRAESTGRAS